MDRAANRLVLAGDLGATKTTLALYDRLARPGEPLRRQTYRNSDFTDFDQLLGDFLDQDGPRPEAACLGVAGPVVGNAVHMTNLNWSIAADQLQARFGLARATLINDLVATALGALHLEPDDFVPLNPGEAAADGAMAVIAPGSGLGEAFLIPHQGTLLACATEGGHVSFAPRTAEQMELLAGLLARQAHVSVEQVCSGLALPDLFAFMATRHPTPDWLATELEQHRDQTPVIVRAALAAHRGERPCEVALRTLELFIDILADEAANLTLKTLARGGLFVGGGLMARLAPLLDPERFMAVFARGTYADMLARIPVRLITNPHTALLGAAAHGLQLGVGERTAS